MATRGPRERERRRVGWSARAAETARLSWFFLRLAAKEHVAPDLHVEPLVAELFLTDNCNLRCVSCACWRTNTKGELTTDEWKDVIRQLVSLPIYKINFTGGEPLIRADAIELMAFARDLGARRLHLNTNAIRLDPPTLDRVLDAGVRSFNISVDGPTGAIHDGIRGRVGAFDVTTRHLRDVVARRDLHRLKIRMSFTVMRTNLSALPDMARLAQELRVQLYLNLVTDRTFLFRDPEVTDLTRVPESGLREVMDELEVIARADRRWLPRYSDLMYVPAHFSDLLQSSLPCAESQLKLMVHSEGQVGGCWGHDPVNNVRETPLAAVIASEHYRQEHARFFRKDCVGCGSNYSLNLRWRPPTYLSDFLWRAGRRSLSSAR
jgi:MoaA/NifB/PqqE/SkfB family radical SAM enzyme